MKALVNPEVPRLTYEEVNNLPAVKVEPHPDFRIINIGGN